MKGILGTLAVMVLGGLLFAGIYYAANIRYAVNRWQFNIQKADDVSRYSTLRKVEDEARAMMASYFTDRIIYNQYKDSESPVERSWGEQARIRANRAAQVYNEFMRKNSFVWKDAIPDDLHQNLEAI